MALGASAYHDKLMKRIMKPLKDKERMFPGSTNLNVKNPYKKPDTKKVKEVLASEEATTTADAGIPQDTKNMGPRSRLPMGILRRKMGIPIHVTDRRVSPKKPPKMRKKFLQYFYHGG